MPPADTNAALYIRPLIFGSGPQLNILASEEYTLCIFVQPVAALHGLKPVHALILEDFDRAAPNGTGSAKVGGNYAPTIQWAQKAKIQGYGITLHLDCRTRSEIEEFSVAGFIGVRRGQGDRFTLTVPDSKSIIKSVISESCLDLARSWGWSVESRTVSYRRVGQERFPSGSRLTRRRSNIKN